MSDRHSVDSSVLPAVAGAPSFAGWAKITEFETQMKLPAGDRAVVDTGKLSEYCLNPDHPRGRHKARVFQSVLGIDLSNSEALREALLGAAATGEAVPTEADQYGRRYAIRFELETMAGRATIMSAWIIRAGEDFPRLVTCFVE